MTSHNHKSNKTRVVPAMKKQLKVKERNDQVVQPQEDYRYKVWFNNYLVHFLGKIKKDCVDKEVIVGLDHCYAKFRKYADQGKIVEYVEHTYNRFQPHMKLISQEDEFLFSPEYTRDHDLRLVSALDIVRIYSMIDQQDDEKKKKRLKKAIWSALRNIYISCCYILGLKGDRWMNTILENLKLQKELDKEIEAEPVDPEENDMGINLPNIADIEKIFNKENAISQLMKDVKEDFNPQDFIKTLNPENKPPIEIISGLFSGQSNDTLMNVASTFTNKIKEKMEKRGYTEDDLKNAAEDIRSDLVNMPGMGMINKLLENVMQSIPADVINNMTVPMTTSIALPGSPTGTVAEQQQQQQQQQQPDRNRQITVDNIFGMLPNLMDGDEQLLSQFEKMRAEWDNLMSTMAMQSAPSQEPVGSMVSINPR